MSARPYRQPAANWVGGVAALAVAQRAALWQLYQPVEYGDTGSYRRLAQSIPNGWELYDGTRTPGYPLFLALAGSDERAWLAQMGLGIAITLLFFYLGWQLSGQPWFGALAALAHSLNLGQLFFEANLLTETLTTFWVTVTLAGVFLWLYHPRWRNAILAALLGVTASLAWLTRPLFIFLPLWVIPFLAVSPARGDRKVDWFRSLAFLLPILAILGIWLNFIHSRFRTWSLTTLTGYHLIQHTGRYFEYVPDEYAALRDTYLEYRQRQIARAGTAANAIWEAIPAMQEASGMSFYQLSRTLTVISLRLIREHPTLYLRDVVGGWWLFWRSPVYWEPAALHWPGLSSWLSGLILAERLALMAANLAFVASSLVAAVWRPLRDAWRLGPALWCLAGTVWLASAVQALADHGDNPRFSIPLQSLVVLWVAWVLLRTWEAKRDSPPAGGAG